MKIYKSNKIKVPVICPNAKNHTEGPDGYVHWRNRAEEKSKTHKQIKCKGCGLYAVRVKK